MLENLNKHRRKVATLVENRVSFNADDVVLSVYDTYANAKHVALASSEVLFCGMLTGKKIMHVESSNYHQPFLPHESFVLAPGQQVFIDFPEAKANNPTTCLAIEISKDKINRVAEELNLRRNKLLPEIAYQQDLVHTEHNVQTQHLLARMLHLFSENEQERRFFIDLALNELIARLLQQQSRDWLLHCVNHNPEKCGLSAAIHYLENHLSDPLDIDRLCKLSGMSRSKFFSLFKEAMHTTPEQWRQQKKISLAKQMLERGVSVTEVAFSLGFNHPSQFTRSFKNALSISPKMYQSQFNQ